MMAITIVGNVRKSLPSDLTTPRNGLNIITLLSSYQLKRFLALTYVTDVIQPPTHYMKTMKQKQEGCTHPQRMKIKKRVQHLQYMSIKKTEHVASSASSNLTSHTVLLPVYQSKLQNSCLFFQFQMSG